MNHSFIFIDHSVILLAFSMVNFNLKMKSVVVVAHSCFTINSSFAASMQEKDSHHHPQHSNSNDDDSNYEKRITSLIA